MSELPNLIDSRLLRLHEDLKKGNERLSALQQEYTTLQQQLFRVAGAIVELENVKKAGESDGAGPA